MLEIFLSTWGLVSLVVAPSLFVAYYLLCVKKISAVNGEIKNILSWLETPREFQDIDAAFKSYNRLEAVWKTFEKSLIKTNDAAYSTTDAAEFFTPQNLTRGMNMTFWQAYGGIFTGLGILGTFGGLTYGLRGVDMTSGDIETLKGGIANLLSGVESAFVTSLVGIACAIAYSIAHHFVLKNFQSNVSALAGKLDETFPRRSAEYWLAESCRITDDQTKSVKEIGSDIATIICDGIADELGEFTDKICEAIDRLGTGGTDKLGEVISNGVGAQMERFSAALDRFSDGIDEKLKTADEISQNMNEQLLNTLRELSETLKQDAKTSADERAADYQKFSETIEDLINTLTEIAEKLKTQQEDTAKDFETLIKNSLDNFNAVMAQIMANSKAGADETNQQNQKASEQFLSTLAGLSKTLQEVAENSRQQQKTATENFEGTVNFLLEDLKNFTQQQKDYLGKTADENAKQISEATRVFSEIIQRHNETTQKTFTQIQNLLRETEKYLQGMEAASTSLKQVAEPVRQSTLQLTRNLSETSAQMKNLSAANQITRQNLSDLSNKLKEFVNNFKGIAGELEKSTNIIKDNLEHYNYEINDGLSNALNKFDSTLGKATSQLNLTIEDLADALENFKKNRR